MTEFEQQVAEALEGPYKKAQGRVAEALGMPPMMQRAAIAAIILDFRDDLTPRAAAAINAIAKPWAADIENEYGSGRVPDGAHYGEIIARAQELALGALRGEP